MGNVFRCALIFCGLLAAGLGVQAQQYPVFTQYYFNELVINPAYAGTHVQLSATAMYRNQWVNFPGAPKTFSVSAHTSIVKGKIGVGFLVNHDEIGSYSNQNVYGYYSYMLRFPKATLSMGIQAGFNILGADFSKLDLQNPEDLSFAAFFNELKPNFGVGILYQKKNFFLGASVPFILNNAVVTSIESFLAEIREARYYFIRGGFVTPIDPAEKVKINPSFLLRTQEGQPLSFDFNLGFIIHDVLSVGASYRNVDALMTFIDLKLSEHLHFGYSYDWTQSEINQFANGSHEFMLNYRVPIRKLHGNVECPSYYQYR
ncbi:MAG TPA: type IX secretion system membrane protein PorP/SprF [Cyclobacteriaceae bacterium]|nr:type IX secretion system membrane protein PorP/SprF [Cyclobacteriaceae bacterium]